MAESEAKVNMSLDDIIKMEKKKKGPQRGGGAGGGGANYRGGGGGGSKNTRGRGYNNRGNMRGRGGYNNRGHNPNSGYNNRNYGKNSYNNYNNHNSYNNHNNGSMNYYNNRNNMNGNRRGVGGAPYRRYQQNGVRGGYVQKRYNNVHNNNNNNSSSSSSAPMSANLRRSRSSVSLNRMSFAGNFNNGLPPGNSYSPRRSNRGGAAGGAGGGGGAYRMSRSRSRSNLRYQDNDAYEDEVYESPSQSFLQRTNSLPDLRDEDSVYNRLGYQNNAQAAYRNRVKRTTSRISNNSSNSFMSQILQRQNKNLKMQNALQLSPSGKGLPLMRQRRYSVGSARADQQLLRFQKRAQYEQKIMRMNASRANIPPLDYMSSLNEYASKQHPALALYQSQNSLNSRQLRSKSPYAQSLKSFQTIIPKTEPKSPRRPPQRRARSRSRSRARSTRNSAISLEGDLEDRSFSEVMYSLSNNFGVTGRTLNDRFSLI